MPAAYFKQHFIKEYLSCAEDKVSSVRREFVSVMFTIKPFFDNDTDLSLELMDILTNLNNDPDKDVREAVEYVDYELLQNRKKNKETRQEEKEQFQKLLVVREKEEEEERKKKSEDDEENKYDSFYASDKKWRSKQSKFSFNRRPIGIIKSTNSGLGTSAKKPSGISESADPKTPLKKKTTMSLKRTQTSDMEGLAQKQRKNTSLIGAKDDFNPNKTPSTTVTGKSKPVRRNTVIHGVNGNISSNTNGFYL